jgi:hypothetical protein
MYKGTHKTVSVRSLSLVEIYSLGGNCLNPLPADSSYSQRFSDFPILFSSSSHSAKAASATKILQPITHKTNLSNQFRVIH